MVAQNGFATLPRHSRRCMEEKGRRIFERIKLQMDFLGRIWYNKAVQKGGLQAGKDVFCVHPQKN